LAKEVKAKAGPTNWRRDAATGRAYALKLTAAGLKAVAVETQKETEAVEANDTLAPTNARVPRRMTRSHSDALGRAESGREKRRTEPGFTNTTEASLRAPRVGSKIDRVLGMLAADKGATLAELIAGTGWLPHTTRAALTGLRKRGFDVLLSREDGASVYRATAPTPGSAR
jgi:DNA-binding IclR family transcriptional regulator